MSKAGVVIWLVIALVLGGAALWLLRTAPPAPAPVRGPVMAAPMARIVELAVMPPGGSAQRVVRDASTGDWNLLGPGGDWPVQIANIQGALRLLTTLDGRDADTSAKPPGPGDAEVRLILDDGTVWTLWLAARSLGGERLVRVQPPGTAPGRTALVDGSLFDALITTGPGQWRVPLAITDPTADVGRITLTALNGRVVLGRINGRWALQEPVVAPADENAVQSLLKNLSAVHIDRFLNAPPDPAAAGFDAPIATATLVSERRRALAEGVEAVTLTRTMTVGGPAGLDGKELYARISRTAAREGQPAAPVSEAMVCIARESVETISMDPASYLTPAAVAMPAGEVGSVEITAGGHVWVFKRTVDGWETESPSGGPADGERVGLLLKLLCEQAAETRVIRPREQPALAAVRLESLGGTPLGAVSIGLMMPPEADMGAGAAEKLLVISGDVGRLYEPAPWRGLLEWIGGAAAR